MIDPTQLLLFIPAALALNLTPGSDMLFCLGQGLQSGSRAGLAASLGIATGSAIHFLLAAFGLAALLAAYPFAFEVVRWVGVAYLVWLGLQAMKNRHVPLTTNAIQTGSAYRAWRNGTLVNLFNPKVAIFILAFVPQFVDPERGSTVVQFLIFGVIFNISGTTINALVGVFAGSIGKALAESPKRAAFFQVISGLVFWGLAFKLAVNRT